MNIIKKAAEIKSATIWLSSPRDIAKNLAGVIGHEDMADLSWIYSMLGLVYKVLMVFMKYSEY